MPRATPTPESLMPRQRAQQTIQRLIDEGRFRPGERLPSDRELASLCQVSRLTVRAAIDELQASQRLDRIPGKGCRVRSTQTHWLMNRTVAVLSRTRLVDFHQIAHGQETFVQSSAAHTIEEQGCHCLLLNPATITPEWQTRFLAERPLGIVAPSTGAESPAGQALAAAGAGLGIPVAVYGDLPALQNYPRVMSDHFSGGRDLVNWLAARGRRRLLRLWTVGCSSYWLDQRNAGCEAAIREAGLELLPEMRVPISAEAASGAERFKHDAHSIVGYLHGHLKDPVSRPDAILAVNDVEAAKIATACAIYGLGPREVWITGYDNYWPHCAEKAYSAGGPVVTVDKNHQEIGRKLAEMVLSPPSTEHRRAVIPHQLVELAA